MTLALAAALALPFPCLVQGPGGAALPPVRQLLANFSFEKLDADSDGSISVAELTSATFRWLGSDGKKPLEKNDLAKLPPEKGAFGRERDRREREAEEKGEKSGKEEPGEKKEKKEKPRDASPSSRPAEPPADSAKAHLERMDANHDGKVTAEEFALPKGWIAQIDRDRDGRISKEEFDGKAAGRGRRLRDLLSKTPAEAFAELDSDADGRLVLEELGVPPQAFERLDADGNGSVSKEELAKGLERMQQGQERRGPEGGKREPGERKP